MSQLVWNALKFAAEKHRDQRRKDADQTPYINHPITVAKILAVEAGITDAELLTAAVLHDTIEDTQTSEAEIAEHFGLTVLDLVKEVTDDKSLPKAERKLLQIEHAAQSSNLAKQLKIADKIANLRDIAAASPVGWSVERKRIYIEWSQQVVAGCLGINQALDDAFKEAVNAAVARIDSIRVT